MEGRAVNWEGGRVEGVREGGVRVGPRVGGCEGGKAEGRVGKWEEGRQGASESVEELVVGWMSAFVRERANEQ